MTNVQRNRSALIIGIDRYHDERLEQLPSCKKNAQDLYALLSSLGYRLFRDGPFIGSDFDQDIDLRGAILDFFLTANVNDTLLLYFSGQALIQDDELYLATPRTDPKQPGIAGLAISDLSSIINKVRLGTLYVLSMLATVGLCIVAQRKVEMVLLTLLVLP
jgi:Caspase domain